MQTDPIDGPRIECGNSILIWKKTHRPVMFGQSLPNGEFVIGGLPGSRNGIGYVRVAKLGGKPKKVYTSLRDMQWYPIEHYREPAIFGELADCIYLTARLRQALSFYADPFAPANFRWEPVASQKVKISACRCLPDQA